MPAQYRCPVQEAAPAGSLSRYVNNLLGTSVVLPGGGMETRLSLAPGQNGTKKLLATYGERLVCVRYRYDSARGVRHKTVELIVETLPWTPRSRVPRRDLHDMVAVRIGYSETTLRERIKSAGGIWRPRHRLWGIDWKTAWELGLGSCGLANHREGRVTAADAYCEGNSSEALGQGESPAMAPHPLVLGQAVSRATRCS